MRRLQTASLSPNALGALWMVGSGVGFTVMAVCVKALAAKGYSESLMIFFRCAAGLVAMAPFLVMSGRQAWAVKRPGTVLLRSVYGTVGFFAGFYALSHLPLAEAQEFFHRAGAASIVTVKLRAEDLGAAFKGGVEAAQPGVIALENREFNSTYNSFKILNFTAWAVGVCAFCLGGLGVANTMLLSVFTRIREIAVLRVCGFSRGQVAGLIFGEAAAIAAAGVAAGFTLGFALLAVLEQVPQFNGYVRATTQPLVLAGIVATAFVTAVLGAIYPARFAMRIQPAEALRYE